MGLKACIVGHSFVRRLGEKISDFAHGRDVPRVTPEWFDLDRLYNEIAVFGQSGYTVCELVGQITQAGRRRPDIVIINCGSNDLCQEDCSVDAVVNGLISYAQFLQCSYGVKAVVSRRTKCRRTPQKAFEDRMREFNSLLKSRTKDLHNIIYGSMRGFWRTPDGADELPVCRFACDGIHPGPLEDDAGFVKYKRNLRRCLLTAAACVLPGAARKRGRRRR